MAKEKKFSFARFFDEYALAGRGLLLAMRTKTFWITFILTFFIFGIILNLLSIKGFGSFQLIGTYIGSGNFAGVFKIISDAFLNIFGIGRDFRDFIINFLLTLLQSILIALVVFVAKHNHKEKKAKKEESKEKKEKKEDKSGGIQSSAIVAGLAFLGSGCPTCQTALLTPIIGTLLSGVSGAAAIAGTISLILNILAIFIGILVFRKLGLETYAIIKSEQFKEKHHEQSC